MADLDSDVLGAQAATLSPPEKQTRFEFVPAMYALYYPAMCETAREMGYALTLHGSMARDLDVVAVPWTAEAASAEDLVAKLVERHKFSSREGYEGVFYGRVKPHGRLAYTLFFGGHFYVDLSVMPREAESRATRAEQDADALARHAEHLSGCSCYIEGGCDCGLREALSQHAQHVARRGT